MISYLSGKIIYVSSNNYLIIKISSGIGYKVVVNPNKNYYQNENGELFIFQVNKEDKQELYGFENMDEVEWLEKLLKVSGVGPKTGANIIYTLGLTNFIEAINQGDVKILNQVKGLGAKTAKKILIELKDKNFDLKNTDKKVNLNSSFALDFVDTLGGLGYKRGEIVSLITNLKSKQLWNETDLVETVRMGLKELGRK